MALQNIEKGERKSYMSYKNDRKSLALLVANGRKTKPTYSEGDAIRDSLNESAACLYAK